MRRPVQPSGEALSATQLIHRVVTHPTQVVGMIRPRREAEAVRLSEGSATRLRWVSVTGTVFGLLTGLLGLLSHSPLGLLVGFLLVSGGMAVASLVELLTPERPSPDERVWAAAKKWTMRWTATSCQ